jgi:hypothetical protein
MTKVNITAQKVEDSSNSDIACCWVSASCSPCVPLRLTEEFERLPHAHLEMIQAEVFCLHACRKNTNSTSQQYTTAPRHNAYRDTSQEVSRLSARDLISRRRAGGTRASELDGPSTNA